MASTYIRYDLEEITDYIKFESLCNDLMSREGFKDIEPLGGFHDKGRDAIHVDHKNGNTIFCYSVREDYNLKLKEDLININNNGHQCDKIIFLSTSKITPTHRDNLISFTQQKYNWKLEIYNRERISTLIENHHSDLIILHSSLFPISNMVRDSERIEKFNRKLYTKYLLNLYDKWLKRYTVLLADYKSIDSYIIQNTKDKGNPIKILDIPKITPISIILGESGSGKTTSLWRIILDVCQNNKSSDVPILINLKQWTTNNNCINIIKSELDRIGITFETLKKEISNGAGIFLLDGLNELPQDSLTKSNAIKDIQNLILNHSNCHFIFTCRSIDFSSSLLDLERNEQIFPKYTIYEIRRLDNDQIIEYIKKTSGGIDDELIQKLNISTEEPYNKNTVLELSRIPLYLKLIIEIYKKTKNTPDSVALLLKSLIKSILDREDNVQIQKLDLFSKQALLGAFSYSLIQKNYFLNIPENIAQSIMIDEISKLKEKGIINNSLTFGEIWQEILSNNFIKYSSGESIEWLHQLIFEYFLSVNIANILTKKDKKELYEFYKMIGNKISEKPISISIGLLDATTASEFIISLAKKDKITILQTAYIEQTDKTQDALADRLVSLLFDGDEIDIDDLNSVLVCLPYYSIFQALFNSFKISDNIKKEFICRCISESIINNYKDTIPKNIDLLFFRNENQIYKYEFLKSGIKRGGEILSALLNNKNKIVQFYAAKGLWEIDKIKSTEKLKELSKCNSSEVVKMVGDLAEEWGLQ